MTISVDMLDIPSIPWVFIGLLLGGYGLFAYVRALTSPLNKIPTVGPSGPITSYWGVLKSIGSMNEMLQEGYDKYYSKPFKIPMLGRWMILLSGPELFEELRSTSDEKFSFNDAMNETLQIELTMGKEIIADPYHVASVRIALTKNLGARFPEIQDEIAVSFSELIPAKEDEWLSVPVYETALQVMVRTANRLFVGLPLCRDPDYGRLNIDFTLEVVKAGFILTKFPAFSRKLVSKFITSVNSNVKRGIRHLGPLITERLEREKQYGPDHPDRPNDLISWLLDYAGPERHTVYDFTCRILTLNFGAIHTTSMALTNVLYDLAVHPEYANPLREELAGELARDDSSKSGMAKLHKLDSFVKESQRLSGSNAITTTRLVMKDITLSDGTFVPKGHFIAWPARASLIDERVYTNPHEFQGFRFADMRGGEGESIKHQSVTLGVNWTTFGGGRHACPGRFFAINEVKAMLIYVLLNYDVKLADAERPPSLWLGQTNIPNRKAHLLFRKRKYD